MMPAIDAPVLDAVALKFVRQDVHILPVHPRLLGRFSTLKQP
jgi:hypothetical protein